MMIGSIIATECEAKNMPVDPAVIKTNMLELGREFQKQMKTEYPNWNEFQLDCIHHKLDPDRQMHATYNYAGDLIGEYVQRQSGIVIYRDLDWEKIK
jgi:hypothetical protein